MPEPQSILFGQQQMGCGGCGGKAFTLFTADKTARIVAQCQACKSTSFIEPEPSKLQIEWGQGDGRLTVF